MLATVATAVVPIAVIDPGVASANDQERVRATSSRTGVTYVGIHSCIASHPAFTATTPQREVEFELVTFENGVPTLTQSFTLGPNRDPRRFKPRSALNLLVEKNVSFLIRDRFKGETGFTDVMTVTAKDCPDYGGGTQASFQPIEPQRVLDTRPTKLVNYAGAKPTAKQIITIPASKFPDRPAGTTAVSMTIVLIDSSAPGFGQLFPLGSLAPGGSANVNTTGPGQTVANSAIVPVAADGSVSVYTSAAAHIVSDVNGYFVEAVGPVAAGRLETITAKRLLDTRPDKLINYSGPKPASGATFRVDLTALSSGLPPGAGAAVVNITAVNSTAGGFVQAAAGGQLVPGASASLNLTAAGQTVGAAGIVPLASDGSIDLYVSASVDLTVDLVGWFTGPAASVDDKGLFVGLTPERIYDSRFDTFVNSEFPATDQGLLDAEAGISRLTGLLSAVVVNGAVTQNLAGGFVEFGNNPVGKTANINYREPFSTVSNSAIVPLSYPVVRMLSSVNAHVIIDIYGYFTA